MKIGDTLFLRATTQAFKRTKNTIHNRGKLGFSLEKMPKVPQFAAWRKDNREWIFLKSLEFPEWSGWLPVEEIEITEEIEN